MGSPVPLTLAVLNLPYAGRQASMNSVELRSIGSPSPWSIEPLVRGVLGLAASKLKQVRKMAFRSLAPSFGGPRPSHESPAVGYLGFAVPTSKTPPPAAPFRSLKP